MVGTKEVREMMDEKYDFKKSFCEMAENEKIKSEIQAYDYDTVKRHIVGEKCTSADVLFLGKNIYFIEFKTGFSNPEEGVNVKTHKENLRYKIRLKAYESLALFEKIILPDVGDGRLYSNVKKHYVAVIDSQERPMEAYADILKEKSGRESSREEDKKKIFDDSLLNYRKSTKNGTKIFYDETAVIYDYEFDAYAEKLK